MTYETYPGRVTVNSMQNPKTIAILIFDKVNAIDVTGPAEVFATARDASGACPYKLKTWSIGEREVKSESGLVLLANQSAPKRPAADLLIVPGGEGVREPATLSALADWLSKHHHRMGHIISICTGAYALAEAGLLDERTVTTHWAHARDLQSRYPEVDVDADALFIRGEDVSSSGGVTAGIDLALDFVQTDLGERAAMAVARELVVFLRRPGAQAQFSLPLQMQTVSDDRLGEVCRWAAGNLEADLSVETLAKHAGLSPRQFTRRFKEIFGTTPATHIKYLRLDAGRTLIGQGVSIERTAHSVGFASADGFSRAFEQKFGIFPSHYQRHFRELED